MIYIISIYLLNISNYNKERLNYKTLLVVQIHDELIFETPKKHIDEASEMIAAEMGNVFKFKVKMKVNYSYGDTWFDLK